MRGQHDLLSMLSQSRSAATSTMQEEAPSTSSRGGEPASGQLLARQGKLQTCDFSTLAACVSEVKQQWVPAKIDQARSPHFQLLKSCEKLILSQAQRIYLSLHQCWSQSQLCEPAHIFSVLASGTVAALISDDAMQIVQSDTATLAMLLRNEAALDDYKDRKWLYLSWQQSHARLSLGARPDRGSSSEAYSLGGLLLPLSRTQALTLTSEEASSILFLLVSICMSCRAWYGRHLYTIKRMPRAMNLRI